MSLRGGFGREAARVFALASVLIGAVACGDSKTSKSDPVDSGPSGFGGSGGGSGGEGGGGSGGDVVGGTPGGGSGGGGAGGVPVGGGGSGGTGGTPACTCDRNLVCDDAGQCVERGPCEGDLDCRAGRICENTACAEGCADDTACAGAGAANQCVEGRCVQCTGDGDCFGRSTCDMATHLCVAPETCDDSRECLAPDVCNVRTHVCTRPFDCRADGAVCGDGLECDAMSGRCAQPVACASNANCPVGQRCSAARPRSCGPCAADDECEGRQVCRQGNCDDFEGCGADADCLGNRTCVEGSCVAPACADDDGEDNDTPETAEMLAGGGSFDAVSCGGDDDYYRLALPRNTAATLSVLADGLGAELDLEVVDASGEAVGAGVSSGLSEIVVAGPYLVDRELIVRVYQRGPAGSAGYLFDLGLQLVQGDVCVDDAVDVRPGDDTLETAQSLRGAGEPLIDLTLAGQLCPMDADWFCVTLGDGEDLRVSGSVTSGNVVIDAELVQAGTGMSLATTQWSRGQAGMELSRAMRGNYCVRLQANSGQGGYQVRFTTASREVAAFCDGAEVLSLDAGGTAHVSGRLPEEDLLTPSCGSANLDGGEVAYALTVDQPKLLVARITGEAGGTLGDPMISVRSDCGSPNGELACNDDRFEPGAPFLIEANPAEIRVPLEAAGTVTIIVDGTSPGERPDYRLDVEVLPLATPPVNDRCDGAVALELQDGLGRIRVSLDRAHDDFGAGCLPSSGPDAVYSLRLAERSRVSAQVFADFASGVYLTSACGGGETFGCGTGFDLNDVPAGDYFLVVEGVGSQARGRVQGQVLVEAVGPAPANDTCATAQRLDAAGGELDASTLGANADQQLADGNQCTGDNTSAGDVLYRLPVVAGGSYFVEATPDSGWDLSLYAMSDCNSPGPTCLAGHDGALTERIEFSTGAADDEVFIAVDGANGEAGRFHLSWGPLP